MSDLKENKETPPMKTLPPCDHDECPPTRCTRTASDEAVVCRELLDIPRRPWLLSKQYGMTFVLSQDNEIILGSDTCRKLGDDLCKYIIESVNARMSNAEVSGGASTTNKGPNET